MKTEQRLEMVDPNGLDPPSTSSVSGGTGRVFQPTTRLTKCEVLYDFRVLGQSLRLFTR